MRTAFSRESARTAKGILISLVVFGHLPSEFFLAELLKPYIYNFHVPCFFLLLIARELPARLKSCEDAAQRVFIRIWPVLPFSFFSFLIYNLQAGWLSSRHLFNQLLDYTSALTLGGYKQFEESTSMEIFWFLYAFYGFYLLHLWFQWELRLRWSRIAYFFGFIVFGSLLVFFIPELAPSWLSVPLYSYPLFLGSYFIFEKSLNSFIFRGKYGFALELTSFVLICSAWVRYHSYNLAHLRVPLPWQWTDYLTWMIFIALAFKLLNRISSINYLYPFFGALGSESLGIYLVHQYLLQGLWLLIVKFGFFNQFILVPLFIFTLLGSFALVVLFKKFNYAVIHNN